MADKKVNIELTKDEAIVFFELLGRLNNSKEFDKTEDQSEQIVLWNIEAMLEKELSEPFLEDYHEIVKKARENLRR